MAVKQKRIKCARCGERETVMRGERGPASIYCDLCRDEVKGVRLALDPYRTLSFYCLRNPAIRQDGASRSERQLPCRKPLLA